MTSEMICKADIICNVSSYHIFLIGGYQFSVFLIDSSNIDTLSAVYSSLIAGQTLLKCQYLLFFLEHHFQKDCNSFGDTSLIFNAWGVPIQTKSSFYYSSPLFWSQGWLDLSAVMAVLGRLQKCLSDAATQCYCHLFWWSLQFRKRDSTLAWATDGQGSWFWLSCLPSWSSVSRVNLKQALAQRWDIKHNKKSFCCHMTAWS